MLQKGVLIDQPGFSTPMEGCWQQSEINTQSQPDIVSKAQKGTHGKDNKSPGLSYYREICQVGLKHMSNWFMLYKRLIEDLKRS